MTLHEALALILGPSCVVLAVVVVLPWGRR
jgi:hypothetical protein